ncbi:MAG: YggS family pyridoxal phosphate-dependent enzyme [Deltaproteobacteria bacterium]|jgi:pyridoxal phosphate enzyme (YggS family)|nr:YggS family pyridoxal phosphate-dependent enzyme [Deltaproteobacteria bacterium]
MDGFLPETEAAALHERVMAVRSRLERAARESGRAMNSIRLVAVSKLHPASMLAEFCRFPENTAPAFGENYVGEGLAKQEELAALLSRERMAAVRPEWHFIGHVQSRKARDVTGRFALIHTLDSEKLAAGIRAVVREKGLAPQAALIQVNIGDEAQKSGVAAKDAEALITAIMKMPELSIQGLMCLPPFSDKAEDSRPHFAKLRGLRDSLARATGLALPQLSMGMSHDCEIAVAEGATLVRIGTDIFGLRPKKNAAV